MLLHIVARGKIARSPEAELVDRYMSRIAWDTKLRTVALDEKGRDLTSEKLAGILGDWRDGGIREARFLIGAADGHSEQQRDEADLLLAFGSATWPHLLARAMLAEQLYRATSILAGHPYHRAG